MVLVRFRRLRLGSLLGWMAILAGMLWIPHAHAQAPVSEFQVKAAYLYKFLGYVEWPMDAFEHPDSPFVVGVAGADATADELASVVAGRQVGGRAVVTRRLRPGDSLAGLHALFVGRQVGQRSASMVAGAKSFALLIVTETEEAFKAGAAINFVVVDSKVRFDVAPRAVDGGTLKISSRLLTVARRVVAG
jgi:hypothetical protein